MSDEIVRLMVATCAGGFVGIAACMVAANVADRRFRRSLNEHAWLLGREVEVKDIECDGWNRYVVSAVGWHGSLCLRRADQPSRRGWWVKRWRLEGNLRVDGKVL